MTSPADSAKRLAVFSRRSASSSNRVTSPSKARRSPSSIPTFIDAAHAIAHNKVMVIDGQVVITGSFNFTKAAEESNAENLLVIRDTDLAGKYAANWETHLRHSERYEGRQAAPAADRSDVRPAGSANGYVGSERSEVFHRASCKSVAKIADSNLVQYASRDDRVAFEGPANDAREAAIVRRLLSAGPLAVVVLGAGHDLSRQCGTAGDVEYLRVTVQGFPVPEG